jgi:hypothetical protein
MQITGWVAIAAPSLLLVAMGMAVRRLSRRRPVLRIDDARDLVPVRQAARRHSVVGHLKRLHRHRRFGLARAAADALSLSKAARCGSVSGARGPSAPAGARPPPAAGFHIMGLQ